MITKAPTVLYRIGVDVGKSMHAMTSPVRIPDSDGLDYRGNKHRCRTGTSGGRPIKVRTSQPASRGDCCQSQGSHHLRRHFRDMQRRRRPPRIDPGSSIRPAVGEYRHDSLSQRYHPSGRDQTRTRRRAETLRSVCSRPGAFHGVSASAQSRVRGSRWIPLWRPEQ